MKLKDFAEIAEGVIQGNPETEITGVAGIMEAKEGDITFVSSPKHLKDAYKSTASCLIVKELLPDIQTPQLSVSNPYLAFAKALECFYPAASFTSGISELAVISGSAVLGKGVSVSPFAFLSDDIVLGDGTVVMPGVFIGAKTTIGQQCFIHPNVVIREGITIGNRVIIHSGTVIGSDGFGYVFEKGIHYKIPQVGGVIIEDDVEIGSNVSIDRATLGNTIICKGTKIDNLVQIAHNVKIGQNSLIVGQVGIGGSTAIGNNVTLAGQVGIADHTTVESGTMIGAQSGLAGHVQKGAYSGSPAIPHRNWLRSQSLFAKLPEINRRLKELEDKLRQLTKEDLL